MSQSGQAVPESRSQTEALTAEVAALSLRSEGVVAGGRGAVAAQGLEQGLADPRLHLEGGKRGSARRGRGAGRRERGPCAPGGEQARTVPTSGPAPTPPRALPRPPAAGRAHLGVAADAARRVGAGLGAHAQRARPVEAQAAGAGRQECGQVLVARERLRVARPQRGQPEEKTTSEFSRLAGEGSAPGRGTARAKAGDETRAPSRPCAPGSPGPAPRRCGRARSGRRGRGPHGRRRRTGRRRRRDGRARARSPRRRARAPRARSARRSGRATRSGQGRGRARGRLDGHVSRELRPETPLTRPRPQGTPSTQAPHRDAPPSGPIPEARAPTRAGPVPTTPINLAPLRDTPSNRGRPSAWPRPQHAARIPAPPLRRAGQLGQAPPPSAPSIWPRPQVPSIQALPREAGPPTRMCPHPGPASTHALSPAPPLKTRPIQAPPLIPPQPGTRPALQARPPMRSLLTPPRPGPLT